MSRESLSTVPGKPSEEQGDLDPFPRRAKKRERLGLRELCPPEWHRCVAVTRYWGYPSKGHTRGPGAEQADAAPARYQVFRAAIARRRATPDMPALTVPHTVQFFTGPKLIATPMTERALASPPDALLLLASTCPFCPTVLQGLSELVKAGRIGRLEVVNIEAHPEVARAHGVRGVPWVRLGPFELEGLRSPAELARWAERAGSMQGMTDYLNERLASGQLAQVIALIRAEPARLAALLPLLADPATALAVRIGISAVMEELAGSEALQALVDALGALAESADARVRADAAHHLALTRSARAKPYLSRLLDDPAADVRELAVEGLAALEGRDAGEPP